MSTYFLWGSELSPYTLKIQSFFDYLQIAYRLMPTQGRPIENILLQARLEFAKRARRVTRHPGLSNLDEYPLVPYLSEDGKRFQYDSTGIALWLDVKEKVEVRRLFPEKPELRFIAQLIDEAMDEFGLYMVHHLRWVTSSSSNNAGDRLATEFGHILPLGADRLLSNQFSVRQVSRLPYLFSVAPQGYRCAVKKSLQPPSIEHWPETHRLLNVAWESYLAAIEELLSQQPYILGSRFTIADASVYGQLSMNLKDPEAATLLRDTAPLTYAWLCAIRDGRHALSNGCEDEGTLWLSPALRPLLDIIMKTYGSLMVQNQKAYESYRSGGETLFNEEAFDQRRALYDGTLMGHSFRSVVKTFQVRVWEEVCKAWSCLSAEEQVRLKPLIPNHTLFG